MPGYVYLNSLGQTMFMFILVHEISLNMTDSVHVNYLSQTMAKYGCQLVVVPYQELWDNVALYVYVYSLPYQELWDTMAVYVYVMSFIITNYDRILQFMCM